MTQPKTTRQNGTSAKEPQKPKTGVSKFSTAYWETRVYRPVWNRDGERTEVAQFFVQIAHGGVRHAVALATNTLEEAGRRAARLFKVLQQEGWTEALRLFRPDAEPILDRKLTIGKYLALVDEYAPLPARTQATYAYAIRRIAADVGRAKLAKGTSAFDPTGKWRDLADGLPLGIITPLAVEDWRSSFLRDRRGDPLAEQRATRSANSFIKNSRALFSRRILDAMRTHEIKLPEPLPFTGVRLAPKTGSTRYRSTIDAGALLQTARTELGDKDPDGYGVVLLALGAGLRRSEIDALQWQNVMPDKGIIRVITTAQRRAKSDESEGDVMVDPGLFSELERTRRPGKTLFVVQPDTEHRQSRAAQSYRADDTFSRVTAWLRKQGIMSDKPLHTLRKEFGSVVAASGDIFQAQRQLRHAQISTTSEYYADSRARATMPIASLLNVQKEASK
jgi:integrase